MKFPVMQNINHCTNCVWCDCDQTHEPNSMAILTGGAMLINRKTGDGGPDERLDGFLDITWHGAHTNEGGVGASPDCFENITIASNIRGGQFDLYFCSTKCLRDFLNHVVDTIEEKIGKS